MVMTKEESTNFFNFMPHGARVLVLGHSHTVKCKSSSLLVYTGAWIKQIKYLVIMAKEGSTIIVSFKTHGAGVLMLRRGHMRLYSEYALFLMYQYTAHLLLLY